jgi:hypothetical protein
MGTTLEPVGKFRDLARDGFSREDKTKIDGEDQLALTLELKEAVSLGGRYSDVELYRVTGEVTSDRVDYPTLLSGPSEVSISRANVVEELALLLAISDGDADSNLLLYSLQVLEPARWHWPHGATSLENMHSNPGRQAELRTGYFYHEILRGVDPGSRTAFLSWLLQSINSFEVSIRGAPGDRVSHVQVKLVAV